VALDLFWLTTAAALPVAALVGAVRWTRPGAGATPLLLAWAAAFLLPFAYALLPVGLLYHVQPVVPVTVVKPPAADEHDKDAGHAPAIAVDDPELAETVLAVEEAAVEFVLAAGTYLMLLPAVLSLIPGALNGCLRVKALLPAAQLPGWLLVVTAPAFLLFWLVILALANHVAHSPLLAAGVLLWAGSPVLYSALGGAFVRPQLTDADAANIGRVKRLVGLTALTGVGLIVAFVLTAEVGGLRVVGFDREAAVATKLEELADDDETGMEDVRTALAEAKSMVYAFDLSSYRLAVDFLAKLLVVTAVFADLVLRATLAAWRADRELRRAGGDLGYDSAAAALGAAL
jgi:hypothetical protein